MHKIILDFLLSENLEKLIKKFGLYIVLFILGFTLGYVSQPKPNLKELCRPERRKYKELDTKYKAKIKDYEKCSKDLDSANVTCSEEKLALKEGAKKACDSRVAKEIEKLKGDVNDFEKFQRNKKRKVKK